MLTVVCAKWFDPNGRWNPFFLYGPGHVQRLRSMVSRCVAAPHRFVCITDSDEGMDGIETFPIDRELLAIGHRYPKLTIFRPDLPEPFGDRILYLDLDCVLTGPLDPLFADDPEFRIWGDTAKLGPYNSSMIYLRRGARPQVWSEFAGAESVERCNASGMVQHGSDQTWIALVLGPNESRWTAADGVLSYKRDCQHGLPPGARAVFFHGRVDPSLPACQARSPWILQHWR
jgi:hypothetical protein